QNSYSADGIKRIRISQNREECSQPIRSHFVDSILGSFTSERFFIVTAFQVFFNLPALSFVFLTVCQGFPDLRALSFFILTPFPGLLDLQTLSFIILTAFL